MIFDVDTTPNNTANFSEPGRERWLDRWCVPRWRALLTWIVLTAVAGEVILRKLSDGLAFAAVQLYEHWPTGAAVWWSLPRAGQAWANAGCDLLLTWLQPWLLRLSPARGLAWIGLSAFAMPAALLLLGSLPSWGGFFQLSLPGLALIGWRTRSWMILPAAALYHGALWLTRGYEIGNYQLVIAGGFYGATLLYGTRLLPRLAASSEDGQ